MYVKMQKNDLKKHNELSDKAGVMRGNGGIGSKQNTPINNKKNRIINLISKNNKKKKRKRDIFDL